MEFRLGAPGAVRVENASYGALSDPPANIDIAVSA